MAEICSICREDLNHGNLAIVECIHIHHYTCIFGWLSRRARRFWNCPVCRHRIREIQVIENQDEAISSNSGRNPDDSNHSANNARNVSQQCNSSSSVSMNSPEIEIIDIASDSEDSNSSLPPENEQDPPNSPVSTNSEGIPNVSTQTSENSPGVISQPEFHIEINPMPSSSRTPSDLNRLAGIVLEPETAGSSHGYLLFHPMAISSVQIQTENPPQSLAPVSSQTTSHGLTLEHNSIPVNSESSRTNGSERTTGVQFSHGGSLVSYSCSFCNANFRFQNSLYRHVARNHRQPFVCDFPSCGRTFTTRRSFNLHIQMHAEH